MRISCIIPAVNEAENIARGVERALASGFSEVIVVDGGSTDDTVDIARECDCRVLESPPGRARQQNAGAEASTGEVLYFQHADNWLVENGADQIRAALANDSALTCGAFRQRIEADGLKYRWLEWGNAARVRYLGAPYGDQGIFVQREAFEAVGGFPEVRILEELLLMRQLRQKSWPRLLAGPLHVNARRWAENGVVRQTLRNWKILTLHALGRQPERLVDLYPRHDDASS